MRRAAQRRIVCTEAKRLLLSFLKLTLFINNNRYKVARRDFFWFPEVKGFLGVLFSFQQRVCVKIIADYTGCLHFRHPFELGGSAFCLSMLWAQVSDVRRIFFSFFFFFQIN